MYQKSENNPFIATRDNLACLHFSNDSAGRIDWPLMSGAQQNGYRPKENCHWILQGAPGTKIQARIYRYDEQT